MFCGDNKNPPVRPKDLVRQECAPAPAANQVPVAMSPDVFGWQNAPADGKDGISVRAVALTVDSINVGATVTSTNLTMAQTLSDGTVLTEHFTITAQNGVQGARGDTGLGGTMQFTSTVTLPANSAAKVEEDAGSTPQSRKYILYVPGGAKGDTGATGAAATLELIGGQALPAGSQPQAVEAPGSTAQNRKYIIKVPVGQTGATGAAGAAGTIMLSGASALAPGAVPQVYESPDSTASKRIYTLGIPQGEKGDTGDKGDTGQSADLKLGEPIHTDYYTVDGYIFTNTSGQDYTVQPGGQVIAANGGTYTLTAGNYSIMAPDSQIVLSICGDQMVLMNPGQQGPAGKDGIIGKNGASVAGVSVESTGSSAANGQTITNLRLAQTLSDGSSVPPAAFTVAAANGKDGADGKQGPAGQNGAQGKAGPAGKDGAAATFTISKTETGAPGTAAGVAETPASTPQSRVYVLTVPQGPQGNYITGMWV